MQLTTNFNSTEFDCHDGSKMPVDVLANIKLVAGQLQILRDYLGESIHVNSGYRSPEHNKKIGGVKNSQHVLGKAADLVVKSKTPLQLHKIIEALINQGKMKEGGLGLYKGFVHYDIRGKKSRWKG
jgi:uncharacterized protein YcbK (DUF882 family)